MVNFIGFFPLNLFLLPFIVHTCFLSSYRICLWNGIVCWAWLTKWNIGGCFLHEYFCPSAVWCFMTTSCHWALEPFESVEIFCFLKHVITLSINSGSTLLYLNIPGLGTDFARGQKSVCCCRYSVRSHVDYLFEFIGLCLHCYSFSTFRGSWFISTLYLSSKVWANLTYTDSREASPGAFLPCSSVEPGKQYI